MNKAIVTAFENRTGVYADDVFFLWTVLVLYLWNSVLTRDCQSRPAEQKKKNEYKRDPAINDLNVGSYTARNLVTPSPPPPLPPLERLESLLEPPEPGGLLSSYRGDQSHTDRTSRTSHTDLQDQSHTDLQDQSHTALRCLAPASAAASPEGCWSPGGPPGGPPPVGSGGGMGGGTAMGGGGGPGGGGGAGGPATGPRTGAGGGATDSMDDG
ncbi:unnamed protein product [Lota lota]